MQFINKVVDHLYAMGGLEGNATDYPVMLCVYLGIFVICAIASVTLCLSRHGERIIWVPDQHKVIKSKFSYMAMLATVYKGNIIKNLIMDCQSYTKYRPNETTGGIFVSWRRKEELPTGA